MTFVEVAIQIYVTRDLFNAASLLLTFSLMATLVSYMENGSAMFLAVHIAVLVVYCCRDFEHFNLMLSVGTGE